MKRLASAPQPFVDSFLQELLEADSKASALAANIPTCDQTCGISCEDGETGRTFGELLKKVAPIRLS
jgi:hypothetical protein